MSKHRREHDPLEGAHPGLSRRAWCGEERYVPHTMPEYIQLRSQLIANGVPQEVAATILGWLVDKWFVGIDRASKMSKAEYRKLLNECEPFDGGRKLRLGAGVREFLAGIDLTVAGVTTRAVPELVQIVQFSAWEYSSRPGRWALLTMTPQGSFVSLEQWPSWEAAKAALEADDDAITWWSM
jgi:hypothetical protein